MKIVRDYSHQTSAVVCKIVNDDDSELKPEQIEEIGRQMKENRDSTIFIEQGDILEQAATNSTTR